jgi:hypothetical protein
MFGCRDCGLDVIESGEYFMINDALWANTGAGDDVLCVGCTENLIGRSLTAADFTDAGVNKFPGSERLESRKSS